MRLETQAQLPSCLATSKKPHQLPGASHISQLKRYHSNRTQYVSKQQHLGSTQYSISRQRALRPGRAAHPVHPSYGPTQEPLILVLLVWMAQFIPGIQRSY